MSTCRKIMTVGAFLVLTEAIGLAQGFPGPPGMPPGAGMMQQPAMGLPPGIQSPELARKVAKIVALRHIVTLGLSRREIETALPILKRLAGAERTLQDQAAQILDEEYRALLAADAGSLPPAESGPRLGQLLARYGQQQAADWDALERSIGPQKARGLRMLVEGPQPWMGAMGPQNRPFQPGAPGPGPGQPGGFGPGPVPPVGPGNGPAEPGNAPQPPQGGLGGPFTGPGGPGRMGPRNMPMQPGGPFGGGFPMLGIRINLSELVDLLQAKLGAMKG
ncbi:MAG: hypothetical protein ACP5VE_13210 [Chthonomonadales bacterium]